MRINNNISALNAWRGLTNTDNSLSKSLEKLSSGLRINRAGDDAAGLAISEKMRGQIRGLNQAVRNAQDGISLIQTAEGALTETHAILQRMRELAVQSANDTNTKEDRLEIQKEMSQLINELDRIGNNTEFNTKKLLDGSAGVQVTAGDGAVDLVANADTEAGTIQLKAADVTLAIAASVGDDTYKALAADDTLTAASTATINGTTFSFTTTDTVSDVLKEINEKSSVTGVKASHDSTNGFVFTAVNAGSAHQITTSGGTGAFTKLSSAATTVNGADAKIVNTGNSLTSLGNGALRVSGNRVSVLSGKYAGLEFTLTAAKDVDITVGTNNSLKAHIGANEGQNMGISINDMRASALKVAGVDVTSQGGADLAVTTINDAIQTVSGERSKLGAYQNRLEHTIKNLGVAAENLSAAESRIRDVDMAAEMMNFTKQNILMQAGTAMLAQANARPQSVLQLLG